MARAANQAPGLTQKEPACSFERQPHIHGVEDRCLAKDRRLTQRETNEFSKKRWGGDQIDPRLFYFRALLESDRLFDGGRALQGAHQKRK